MAGGRIYTDIVTVGVIEIYSVTSDPNGVLSARIGSLAIDNSVPTKTWQNTDGASAWKEIGSSLTLISTSISTILAPGTNYVVLVDASAGPVTITLPAAAASSGNQVTVKKIDGSANLVTVAAAGGDTVETLGSFTIGAGSFREGVKLDNDATTSWWVTADFATSAGPGTANSLLLFGAGTVGSSASTRYLYPTYDDSLAQTSTIRFVAPFAGTLSNFYLRQNTPLGNGATIVYTVRVNGVASALSVSIPSTTAQASDLISAVAVAQGDLIDVEITKAATVATSPRDVSGSMKLVA